MEEYDVKFHSFLGARCAELDSPALAIGGGLDHIHIICLLSKKIALMDLLKILKSRSSGWLKSLDSRLSDFYWQDGYGAFSVNPDQVSHVINYVQNQRNHHKKFSFKDEYLKLLNFYNVDYDENFLWSYELSSIALPGLNLQFIYRWASPIAITPTPFAVRPRMGRALSTNAYSTTEGMIGDF